MVVGEGEQEISLGEGELPDEIRELFALGRERSPIYELMEGEPRQVTTGVRLRMAGLEEEAFIDGQPPNLYPARLNAQQLYEKSIATSFLYAGGMLPLPRWLEPKEKPKEEDMPEEERKKE